MFSIHENKLKAELVLLKQEDFSINDSERLNKLLDAMLQNIGTLDSELRDDLILESFYSLVCKGKVQKQKLIDIANKLIGKEYLTFKIESNNELWVFKRSFSILFIDIILEWNKKAKILDYDMEHKIFDAICAYYEKERNHKGFYKKYGWAHAIAHTADAFCDLLASEKSEKSEVNRVLELVKGKYSQTKEYLVDGEDERTANIIKTIVEKDKEYEGIISEWILGFKSTKRPEKMPDSSQIKGNIRNLLRSIYFKVDSKNIKKDIEEVLLKYKYT